MVFLSDFLINGSSTLKDAIALTDTRKRLLAVQHAYDRLKIAARALDSEPCGRGLSKMATDIKRGKIILFGGCRLDSYLVDTWIYHCKERVWEQRWPEISPAPRGGHVLAWMPESGKTVLFGATPFDSHYKPPYQTNKIPRDLWVYDILKNTWKRIKQSGKVPANGTGTVGPGDTLVYLPRPLNRRAIPGVWGMRVDADAPDEDSAKHGVPPGTVTYIFHGPERFDSKARIELEERYPDCICNIRGLGFLQGFTVLPVNESRARNLLLDIALKEHLLLMLAAGTHSIRLRPNLSITRTDIACVLERLESALIDFRSKRPGRWERMALEQRKTPAGFMKRL